MIGTEYEVVRSDRKTYSIQIKESGVIVRAPLRATDSQIKEFVNKHDAWIKKNTRKVSERAAEAKKYPPLTRKELEELADRAGKYLPGRVSFYAAKLGVQYGSVTIRNQKTKWGSCSSKKNLNFNCLLMLMPEEIIDSVVAHEVCHLREMNHSPRFYALVESIFPEYRKCEKWLKENGSVIMSRNPV